jgi:uncharacterized protein (DUF302 family)
MLMLAVATMPMTSAFAATAAVSDSQEKSAPVQQAVTVVPSTIKASVSTTTIQVVHQSMALPVKFDVFTRNLGYLLGRYDPGDFALAAIDPKHGMERLHASQGEQGMMLFQGSNDHGALFATIGQSRKAMRYHVGNPLIALQMTRHNISAALYAPLTILVYQVDENTIRVEYDLPSTLFGQFHDPAIDRTGQLLDVKLSNLLYKAASLKPE